MTTAQSPHVQHYTTLHYIDDNKILMNDFYRARSIARQTRAQKHLVWEEKNTRGVGVQIFPKLGGLL